MAAKPIYRPIVRSFSAKFAREAAAHVRAGGHAVYWEKKDRALLVFGEPAEGDADDFGLWSVYDMAKWRWKLVTTGPLKGLASTLVPRSCHWIVRRRAERDSIHPGSTRKVDFDCTKCAACCHDNEVVLLPEDVARLESGGRADLTKAPYAKRQKDGRILLTLLPSKRCRHLQTSNRCGIYELRPNSCSEFPMGSECCLFAREDVLGLHDGAVPNDSN
jgi:Fe-S-cluster containining protein